MGKTTPSKRTNLYVVCALLFPLPFVGFVLGFSFPVWRGTSDYNLGLWQSCEVVVDNCTTVDFNDGGDWMVGVRAVEIFALVMFVAAAIDLTYENCCTNFKARPLSERLGAGIICILGGLGGLAGVVVFVVKIEDSSSTDDYGWAFALVTASSALVVILGIGLCVSGFVLEPRKTARQHGQKAPHMNGRTPHLTSDNENYEVSALSTRNPNLYLDPAGGSRTQDNMPGFAVYNGMMNQPGQRSSLPPLGMSTNSAYLNTSYVNGRGGGGGVGVGGGMALPPTGQSKHSQYYSLSDDRLLDPSFDLSEGFSYVPSRSSRRGVGQDNPAYAPRSEVGYYGRSTGPSRLDDPPYSRSTVGARREDDDPYNRVSRGGPPRAGYNDPYGFDRLRGSGGGGGGGVGESQYDRAFNTRNTNGGAPVMRDSYYRRF